MELCFVLTWKEVLPVPVGQQNWLEVALKGGQTTKDLLGDLVLFQAVVTILMILILFWFFYPFLLVWILVVSLVRLAIRLFQIPYTRMVDHIEWTLVSSDDYPVSLTILLVWVFFLVVSF
jgi:hypothetical protein